MSTQLGPRSTTLSTFRTLTDDVVSKAVERSGGSLTPDQVRHAARRAGAPIEPPPAQVAASRLIRELADGATLPPGWAAPLAQLLSGGPGDGNAASLAEWADATPQRRGDALRDLLLLADAVPRRRDAGALTFPGLRTSQG